MNLKNPGGPWFQNRSHNQPQGPADPNKTSSVLHFVLSESEEMRPPRGRPGGIEQLGFGLSQIDEDQAVEGIRKLGIEIEAEQLPAEP